MRIATFKVLIAVDGSTSAKQALEFARELLAGKESAVTLFHVIPQHTIYGRAEVAAENDDADLIIMGSRGLNAASRFLVGSTSTKVATHAHCAVLVVHPKRTTASASKETIAQTATA